MNSLICLMYAKNHSDMYVEWKDNMAENTNIPVRYVVNHSDGRVIWWYV
jgi:hypothetical protein